MKIIPTKIPEVLEIKRDVHRDDRGYFIESCKNGEFGGCEFVQDNLSFSIRNVIRGLHYQLKYPQAKLISVAFGKILDVAVDIRIGSPTFGKYVSRILYGEFGDQLFIPIGFAHGFKALSEEAIVYYKCTDIYHPEDSKGIIWNDPDIDIDWGMYFSYPTMSKIDSENPLLKEAELPIYQSAGGEK